jgi:hypothetical protein
MSIYSGNWQNVTPVMAATRDSEKSHNDRIMDLTVLNHYIIQTSCDSKTDQYSAMWLKIQNLSESGPTKHPQFSSSRRLNPQASTWPHLALNTIFDLLQENTYGIMCSQIKNLQLQNVSPQSVKLNYKKPKFSYLDTYLEVCHTSWNVSGQIPNWLHNVLFLY